MQALIVADAYKRTSWTDWVGPLYKKVVIGGHFHYLTDYKTTFSLKANMFQELASRLVYILCLYMIEKCLTCVSDQKYWAGFVLYISIQAYVIL